MLTRTPAEIIGIRNIGCIKKGCKADIVIFDSDFKIKTVLLAGKMAGDKKKGKSA